MTKVITIGRKVITIGGKVIVTARAMWQSFERQITMIKNRLVSDGIQRENPLKQLVAAIYK